MSDKFWEKRAGKWNNAPSTWKTPPRKPRQVTQRERAHEARAVYEAQRLRDELDEVYAATQRTWISARPTGGARLWAFERQSCLAAAQALADCEDDRLLRTSTIKVRTL